jgi:hypothetical protein
MVRVHTTNRRGGARNVGAEQAKIFVRAKVETPVASSVAPGDGGVAATHDVVLGNVHSGRAGKRNAGVATATAGASFVDRSRSWLKRAVVGALLGAMSLAPLQRANADTVFLDHNNAPHEIATARQLAAERGEEFVLVRPDAASIERLFAQAERGEVDLRHLIISGHSGGSSFSGTGPDGTHYETSLSQYKELKKRYPRAFAQVRHVTFLACYAGSMSNSAQWRAVFENAVTIGFHGIAPSKERPASTQVLANTERYLRQHVDGKRLTPAQMQIHARNITRLQGPNITNFAVRLGDAYASVNEQITNVDVVRDRVNLLRERAFSPYMNPVGQDARFSTPPPSSQRSEVQDYYRALQQLRNTLEAGSWEHGQVQQQADVALRLFHWQQVLDNVQRLHAQTFAAANLQASAAGLDVQIPANLTQLSRLQIVELANQLDALGALPDGAPELAQARTLLSQGLRDLSPEVIPQAWID